VAANRGPKVVIANGAESEPVSRKDATLLWLAPNLVLDGLQLAADAVGADRAILYLHGGTQTKIAAGLGRALAERSDGGLDRVSVSFKQAPARFLAGQETALVNRVNEGPALPLFNQPRVSVRGAGGEPTVVQNVESLAHLALIARYGAQWFRSVGTGEEPGSMLATVYDGQAQVTEVALGQPLKRFASDAQAVLVGGYHGTWLAGGVARTLTLENRCLRGHGASVGAGVIAALPSDRCGLAETARVTRYLAAESAGQCGPCLNGLPRIAGGVAELAGPRWRRQTRGDVERWAGLVTGRGACHHPDGAARFVRSALVTFAGELVLHEKGQCSARNHAPFLPVPDAVPATEEEWR
jgi:NADH:ubiquinone oxidoreductase subunit F (NADH-binding)